MPLRARAVPLAWLTLAVLWLAACSGSAGSPSRPPERPTAGVQTGNLVVQGRERSYRLYVPGSLPADQPAALVIAMHGGLGTPDQFAQNSRFDQAAEAHGFLVVYPEGIGRTWNGGACCGQAARQNIDDVAFIAALIDRLAKDFPIDPARVFATGHSNGAIMAFRLACELSQRIAAIAAVAGSLEVDSCAPSRPVAVLAIHGDADLNHPIDGGRGPNSIAGVDFVSLAASMETLRRANGCSAETASTREGEVTTTVWRGCLPGGETVQKVIAGASHAWPGAASSGTALVGPPSQALDATEEIWRFFEAHARPAPGR